MPCVVRRTPLLKPVWKPVLNCQNLATWFSYIVIWWNQFEVSWRFNAHQWNSIAIRESSSAIILKSCFFSTGHSACRSEVWDIFWSSDLCTQLLMTADVLECSLTLKTLQFNDGARPYYYNHINCFFRTYEWFWKRSIWFIDGLKNTTTQGQTETGSNDQKFSFSISLSLVPHPRFRCGLVSLFNGISTFVGYLMPKPFS